MRESVKRLREEEEERENTNSKDLKLSTSCGEEDSEECKGKVFSRILQFESVSQ